MAMRSSKKAVELTIERDPKEEALKPPIPSSPYYYYHGESLCDRSDYEIRLVRINGALVETSFTIWGSAVYGWIDYMRRDHRGRLAPLVAGVSFYRGLPTGSWRLDLKGAAQAPNHHANPIRAVSICLGGTHCLVYRYDGVESYEETPAVNPLRCLLEDRRMKVVGFGIKKMAAKLEAQWGVRVANPVEVTTLAATAFGKEKVFESKKKGKAIVMESLDLEGVAEVVLDGMKMPKKPARVTEAGWSSSYHDERRTSEEQVMYATSDAFLCFQIGKKCFEMMGVAI